MLQILDPLPKPLCLNMQIVDAKFGGLPFFINSPAHVDLKCPCCPLCSFPFLGRSSPHPVRGLNMTLRLSVAGSVDRGGQAPQVLRCHFSPSERTGHVQGHTCTLQSGVSVGHHLPTKGSDWALGSRSACWRPVGPPHVHKLLF